MSNWHNEVFAHELDYLTDDFGIPIPIMMEKFIDKYAPKVENGTMEADYQYGCTICGSVTGLHGFSFDRKNAPEGG